MLINFLFTKHKRLLVSFLITFSTLVFLGVWQLIRLQEKNNYIDSVYKSINQKAKELLNNQEPNIYQKIIVNGNIEVEKYFWLYRRHPLMKHQDGAYLVFPIKTDNLKEYLIVLGWVKKEDQEVVLKEIASNKRINIEGLVIPGEKPSIIIPNNDFSKKLCFTMDMEEINKNLNIQKANYFVAALKFDPKFSINIAPITSEMMIKIKNDHMEYAVTWFSLAIGLCFVFYLYIRPYCRIS